MYSFFCGILVSATGVTLEPELCFLPGQFKLTLLSKERYGLPLSLSGRGSIINPLSL